MSSSVWWLAALVKIAIIFTRHRWYICGWGSLWCSVIELFSVRASFHGLGFCCSYSFPFLYWIYFLMELFPQPSLCICVIRFIPASYTSHTLYCCSCVFQAARLRSGLCLDFFLFWISSVPFGFACFFHPSYLWRLPAYHYSPLGLILFCYHSTSKSY